MNYKKITILVFAFFIISLSAYSQDITIKGKASFQTDFTVPKKSTLIIYPGSNLKMGDNVKIIINGKIIAKGTKEKPIIFEGNNDTIFWQGIKIIGSDAAPNINEYWKWIKDGDKEKETLFLEKIKKGNIFEYCIFKNTATGKPFKRGNRWKATIQAYNTSIRVSYSKFENIFEIGGVLTKKSYEVIDNNIFDDKTMHKAINSTDSVVGILYNNIIKGHRTTNQTCADGIWTRDFVGLIASNTIDAVADDGIDTDNSKIIVLNNNITNACDDGIDIDSKGIAYIIKNNISSIADNGILMSNQSKGILVKNTIKNSPSGLTLRNGANIVANKMEIKNNGKGVLLFHGIPCMLSNEDFNSIKIQLREYEKLHPECDCGIKGVKSAQDAINIFEKYYTHNNDYWIFNQTKFETISQFDKLKKLFKYIDVLNLKYFENKESKLNSFCIALKNSLYMTCSTVKDNKQDIALFHSFKIKIKDTEFTNTEKQKQILDKYENIFSSELINELNADTINLIEINAENIIKKIVRQLPD